MGGAAAPQTDNMGERTRQGYSHPQQGSSPSPALPAITTPQDKRHAQFYIGARNGLVDGKHIRAMGMAVWLFLWCLGRQTTADGHVLGGKEVSYQEVAGELGQSAKTIRNWADCLRARRYIETARGKRGLVWRVINPKKFRHYERSLFQVSPNLGTPLPKSGRSDSRILLMKSKGEGKGRTRAKSTRSSVPSLAGEFQKLAEQSWTLRYQGAKPTWGVAEFTLLAKISSKHAELGLEGLGRVWGNFLASTDRFITDRGHNPKDFWTHFDGLRRGPILLRGVKADAATRTQENIAAVREFLRRDGALDGNLRRSLPPAG